MNNDTDSQSIQSAKFIALLSVNQDFMKKYIFFLFTTLLKNALNLIHNKEGGGIYTLEKCEVDTNNILSQQSMAGV